LHILTPLYTGRLSSSKSASLPKIAPLPPKPGATTTPVQAKPIPVENNLVLPQKYASAAAASITLQQEKETPVSRTVTTAVVTSSPTIPVKEVISTPEATFSSIVSSSVGVSKPVEPKKVEELKTKLEIDPLMFDSIPKLEDCKNNSVLSDLANVFESVKWNSSNERNYYQMMIDTSLQYHPEAQDSEKYFYFYKSLKKN
jgi:hypothetical protein